MQNPTSPLVQLENVAAHLRGLIVSEWRLARSEMAHNLRAARTGLILAVAGVGAALAGFVAATGALFLGLAAVGLPTWLAALITAATFLIAAVVLLWAGLSRLSPDALAPKQTAAHAAKSIRLVTERTHVS